MLKIFQQIERYSQNQDWPKSEPKQVYIFRSRVGQLENQDCLFVPSSTKEFLPVFACLFVENDGILYFYKLFNQQLLAELSVGLSAGGLSRFSAKCLPNNGDIREFSSLNLIKTSVVNNTAHYWGANGLLGVIFTKCSAVGLQSSAPSLD